MPTRPATIQGLRPLEIDDLARYKAAVESGQQVGWTHYFPYLLAKSKPGRSAVLLAADEDPLCVFQWRSGDAGPRLELLFPPIPMNRPVLERALERANDFNGDRSARVLRIDERDAKSLAALPSLRLEQRRAQYIYAPADYEDLGGRRYRTLRRQVAQFEDRPGVEVVPYSRSHADACLGLLDHWRKEHRDVHGTAGGGGTTARAIRLAGTLAERDLRGELVYVDGRLAAFAFGGEIRPGLACFFDAKSDGAIPGLSYAHRRSFLLNMRDFERVNDGSDTGRPGLRQLKDSFRPVAMHTEYRASQTQTTRSTS